MKTKTDKSYWLRGNLIRVGSVFIAGGMLFGIAANIETERLPFWIAGLLLLVLAGLCFELWLHRSYRCPDCGKRLPPPTVAIQDGEKEYVHFCESCDITWKTRTSPPDV